jgi:dolichol-phosphate mannosyltransferase
MLLSIVVPVYNEERNVGEFVRRMLQLLPPITDDFEIIFALDPSTDRTEEELLEHRSSDSRIKLLKFSRRVGQPMATLAGLEYSTGDAVVVMDVDLQDPPELLGQMVAKWRDGYDVVLPQRQHRTGEPWIKKLVAAAGYRVINKIADVAIPPNTGDFRLMSRRVVDEVLRLRESHGFLRGMVAIVGFRQALLPFDRPARFAGRTNYNRFLGSLRIGFNGIFCFSTYALKLSTLFGFILAGGTFLFALLYLIAKVLNLFPFASGNPTIVILILFLGGIQLISVGILGEYIGRIYEEVRARPRYVIDRAEGFASRPPTVR